MEFHQELDARGLKCPLPILRCKKALAGVAAGEILKVTATDPGSVRDFQAFCKQTGHEMLSMAENADAPIKEFIFHIRKRAA